MSISDPSRSVLLLIDFQSRLMPALVGASEAVGNARRLVEIAKLLGVPAIYTEQNPRGLGATIRELSPSPSCTVVPKMTFDAWRSPELQAGVPPGAEFVVTGCEAHICVLQTVLGLLTGLRRVKVVSDAVASREPASREAALARMERHGAEIVTAEMVIFEWLGSADHPQFKQASAIVK